MISLLILFRYDMPLFHDNQGIDRLVGERGGRLFEPVPVHADILRRCRRPVLDLGIA
ncbi:hypothetical protein J27TS7_53630 [Paenibacillus dendritiformis]|nr:hypothetical protein J27TS7_53630 [Paenibacillus dendritiformis]